MADPPDSSRLLAEALTAATAGRLEPAVRIWRELLAVDPYLLEAQQNLALALFKLHDYQAAFRQLEQGVLLFPADPMLALWQGHAAQKFGDTGRAAVLYARAAALDPGNPSTWLVLAMARRDLADYPAACTAIEQFLRLRPADPQGHFEYAQLLLGLGRWDEGFAEYEWRFQRPTCPPREYPYPRWDGTVREGFRLLVSAEQGYGDTIQFARFIPQLAGRGVEVTLACYPELLRLLRGLPGLRRIVELGKEPMGFDATIPVMSLGSYCLLESLSHTPALSLTSPGRPLLPAAPLESHNKKIGLVWAGSGKHTNDASRSIPWPIFSRLLRGGNHGYYSLQIGGERPEPWPEQLIDLSPLIHDYADTAALIDQLDLVVTVDTSVAHVAGALGKPFWLLLPYAPDWRWLLQEQLGPWYGQMRMFRQARLGEWRGVIAEVLRGVSEL